MRTILQPIALALFLSLSTSALAQAKEDRAQAEQSLNEGIQAYKDGRYEEALTSYQRAAELAPSAAGPYREMGKAYEALGRTEDAKLFYQEYLRRKPNAQDTIEINERLAALGAKAPLKESALVPVTTTEDKTPSAKKRSPWVWVAGGATLVGLGVGTAIAIDVLESGSGKGGKGNDEDKAKSRSNRRAPLVFTFVF